MNNNTIERSSTFITTAIYSKDNQHRYCLRISWDETKPRCAIIMTYPSTASELLLDQTTMIVRNAAVQQGYGSISILNLFSCVKDEIPKSDKINTATILNECASMDVIIIGYGRSNSHEEKNRNFFPVTRLPR